MQKLLTLLNLDSNFNREQARHSARLQVLASNVVEDMDVGNGDSSNSCEFSPHFLLKRDVLGTRQTPTQDHLLGSAHRHVLGSLGDSFDGTQGLRNTIRLVRKLQKELLTQCGPLQCRTNGALRSSHRSLALNHKVLELVVLHKLHHVRAVLGLALTDCLDLGLKCTNLIVCGDPLPKRVANCVDLHCVSLSFV